MYVFKPYKSISQRQWHLEYFLATITFQSFYLVYLFLIGPRRAGWEPEGSKQETSGKQAFKILDFIQKGIFELVLPLIRIEVLGGGGVVLSMNEQIREKTHTKIGCFFSGRTTKRGGGKIPLNH